MDAASAAAQTLSPKQRQRIVALAMFVLRDLSDAVEHRRMQSMDDED